MAIEKTIVIKGDTSDAEQSFESLGKTIQEQIDITIEFEKELQDLEQQLKDTPKGSLAAQKDLKDKIVGLKGAIKDQGVALKSLNNEQKKANAITKTSIKDVGANGGAIAVLDSVTGGLATRVRDAAEATKLFNFSLKGTKAALLATGIGAFVIAIGLVVTYWDDIVDFITQANAKLENQLTLVESIQGVLEGELAVINKQLELNKLQGKANEELEKQRVAILERLREQNDAEIKILENQLDRLRATSTEVGFWETIKNNVAFTLFGTKALASESANLAAQRLAEINALSIAIETAKLKEIDLAIQLFNAENPEGTGDGVERGQVTGVTPLSGQEDIDRDLEIEKVGQEKSLEQTKEFLDQQTKLISSAARIQGEVQIKWADLAAEQKLAIAGAVLQDAAKLVDQNSVAGKGIAIAQTGISTAQGIMNAFATLPTIAAIPAAAIIGALGIKSTIDIVKKKIPSATGRGFVSGGAGGGASAASAPAFNLVEGNENSQINDSINLNNNQPVQAVVVSGDVTTAQSVDRNIVSESGL
tara:strand:+ start:5982 stop:7583 length:1602 start_codon:yes stop_codon:yes gene_type:complete